MLKLRTSKKSQNLKKSQPDSVSLIINTEEPPGSILKRYTLPDYPQVEIVISEDRGVGYYYVKEPVLSDEQKKIFSIFLEKLYYGLPPIEGSRDPLEHIKQGITEAIDELGIEDEVKGHLDKYVYYLRRELGYSVIEPLVKDQDVEEIECVAFNRPITVVHRVFSEFPRLITNITFGEEDVLRRFVERLTEISGKSVNIANPIQDFIMKEGHRVAVSYLSEVSLPGTTFTIRKFPEKPFSITELLKNNAIHPIMASYLWVIAEAKRFMFVCGPTGSGKTTLLNVLLTMLNPLSKIVTIEDTPEIRIPHKVWMRFFVRPASYLGTKEVGMGDLIKLALRVRPDYIVIGEVRGSEMSFLVQASATGHGGLTTLHAASLQEAIARVSALLPPDQAQEFKQLITAVTVVRRITDPITGRQIRRVTEVSEYPEKQIFRWGVIEENDRKREAFFLNDKPLGKRTIEEEVDSLLNVSYRFNEEGRPLGLALVSETLGWSRERLRTELVKRTILLKKLLESNATDYSIVAEKLAEYYKSGEVD